MPKGKDKLSPPLCTLSKRTANFSNAMKKAEADVRSRLGKQKPADRIDNNWTVLLSVFLSLDGLLDFPFQYEHLLELCVSGIIRQDRLCAKTDELSRLWDIISSAHQKGIFVYEQNYVIRVKSRIKVTKDKGKEEEDKPEAQQQDLPF